MVERLGLGGKFIVQYSGNMGMWHDIAGLVETADKLRDEPDVQLLFIGDGARRKEAEELSRELKTENITWHPFVPIEQLRESLSTCHVALISLRAGFEGIAVPSKLYGILASGRAIIAHVPRESEVAYVVEEERCGLVVEPSDAEGVKAAILELASDPERVRKMGVRAFEAYCAKYRQEQAIRAFRELWSLPEPSARAPHDAPSTATVGQGAGSE